MLEVPESIRAPASVPVSSAHGTPRIDKVKEDRLVRKVDMSIIPMIMVVYLFSFLDRVNIGNARLYGLEADLKMSGNMYQTAVSIFFVTYCLFEVPSNLLLAKVKPGRYLGVITVIWGLITTLTGLVHNYRDLLVCRVLLGVFEAGLFPGLVSYLTLFYNRKQLALRIGSLFSSSALAGVLGGIMAYGVGYMDGTAGMRAWRWILILQGIPSVTIGVLFLFIVPNSVDTARFLNPEERLIMHSMRTRERGQTASAQKFHWVDTKEGLKDPQIWIYCLAQFGEDIMLYGFSIFLPTILMGIGTWTPLQIQALTVPVYALGVITYLAVSRISDKTQQRGVYASLFAVISIIGYAFLLSNRGGTVSYAGCFLVAIGLYVSNGVSVAWLAGNLPRYGKRTLGSAMQLTGGNAAGIFAPFIYPTSGSPRFVTGHAVTLAVVTMSAAIFVGMRFYYVRINKNRAEGKEDWKMEGKTDAEIEEMGDKSPRYIYIV